MQLKAIADELPLTLSKEKPLIIPPLPDQHM
jgi:hypothetical protein